MSSEREPLSPGAAEWNWTTRNGLLLVGLAPLFAQLIGSAFNIWYNLIHIRPLLTAAQHERFATTILIDNVIVYPIATAVWVWVIVSLRRPFRQLLAGETLGSEQLIRAQRRTINLPWWSIGVAGPAWLLTIPVLLLALSASPERLNPHVYSHFPISVIVAALIALNHGVFAVELASLRLLYPVMFRDENPADIPGAYPLSLRGRGFFWAISAVVCPVVSLLLLTVASPVAEDQKTEFVVSVAVLAILFGLASAWMLGRLVVEPIHELRRVTQEVASGNLQAQVRTRRADEFGPLIANYNQMVASLREKQYLQEQFGRHVGHQAARRILDHDPDLGGTEQELTIMFADLRNFTARSSLTPPQEVVAVLNLFFTEMVDIVERRHEGMVDKFLGDGLMALFGAGDPDCDHATMAVAAGRQMLDALEVLNGQLVKEQYDPLTMGIGIHTGTAVVGSIGSDRRCDYTAIGETVNIAARVESLTKTLRKPLLLTAATRDALTCGVGLIPLPPQKVKGLSQPLAVFGIREDGHTD